MSISEITVQYLLPVGLAALAIAGALTLLALLAKRGIAPPLWGRIASHRLLTAGVVTGLLVVVGVLAFVNADREREAQRKRDYQYLSQLTNLVANPLFADWGSPNAILPSPAVSGTATFDADNKALILGPQSSISSNMIAVRPGETYLYGVYTFAGTDAAAPPGKAQARLLWYDSALNVKNWDDSPPWAVDRSLGAEQPALAYHLGAYRAPEDAARVKFEVKNAGSSDIWVQVPKLAQQGVYIEQHPNGALGSLAFSFDWETAMGGPIHSKGMEAHDPASAAAHGMAMRQGADWLKALFDKYGIKATFYATGFNLLDGNTERRTFSGDPTYKWAGPRNRWASDWWLNHPWYGDDPFGTVESDPAWYFGDQTRALLSAGHEIAPHTFGHLYVRGSNPEELSDDMDEWLASARTLGIITPTTFAFPWRSSNSLTPAFYDVLYSRGVRAVTRIYERDMQDLFTLGAVGAYPNIAVMPDFLLGVQSISAGEEAAGAPVGADEGLRVIAETINRRGTTSLWQHPEQLAPMPELAGVRDAWERVVAAAADQQDKGKLWIGTVAEITAYQRDLMSVSATLAREQGGWKLRVNNALDRPIRGVTLTLPGDVALVASSQTDVRTVYPPAPDTIALSVPGEPAYPARQLVLTNLEPGSVTIDLEWVPGQEPVR